MRGRGVLWGVEDSIYNPEARSPDCYAIHIDPTPKPWSTVVANNVDMLKKGEWDYIILGKNAPEGVAEYAALKLLRPDGHLITWERKEYVDKKVIKKVGIEDKLYIYKLPSHYYYHINKNKNKNQVYNPSAPKRACIARYGALGDYIMITPLIKALADDGYEVTLNGTTYSINLAKGNPYIKNTIVQERNIIPNPLLGEYWKYWEPRYDKYINLSESIEGKLLKLEGRKEFYTPLAWRNNECQANYYDYTLKLGGYEHITGQNGTLYFNDTEEREAKEMLKPYNDKFVVGWALRGSSHHKTYPLSELVAKEFINRHPDSIILWLGDSSAQPMEHDLPSTIKLSGKLSPRQSACLIKHINCLISPESFLANVSGCFNTPKIIYLSHSGPDNLTKYWKNCITLRPDTRVAPCYGTTGCHQLHYSLDSCPLLELYDDRTNESFIKTPACTVAVSTTQMLESIEQVYNNYTHNLL
jgi:ADP-heptose:LPS heptosyltransferase